MNNYEDVRMDPNEVCSVFRRLKKQLKTDRIYFKEDELFGMKYRTLICAASEKLTGMKIVDNGFEAVDNTIRFDGDRPRTVRIEEDDVLLLIDNTKCGWFSSLPKLPCSNGALVTKKGMLVFIIEEKKVRESGFVEWCSFARTCPDANMEIGCGIRCFRGATFKPYPKGPYVSMHLVNVDPKRRYMYWWEMGTHLWHLARGKTEKYDVEYYCAADPMGDAEDGDSMGNAD